MTKFFLLEGLSEAETRTVLARRPAPQVQAR